MSANAGVTFVTKVSHPCLEKNCGETQESFFVQNLTGKHRSLCLSLVSLKFLRFPVKLEDGAGLLAKEQETCVALRCISQLLKAL